jgi:hypothetical protein
MRARRPWLTILTCWVLNSVAVIIGANLFQNFALLFAVVLVGLYLYWKSGGLLLGVDRLRGQAYRNRVLSEATDAQRETYERLAAVEKDVSILYRVNAPADFGGLFPADALVVAKTGVFAIFARDALGRLRVALSGRNRVTVEGRSVDSYLFDVATTSSALAEALRVEITALVTMVGSTFPPDYPGIIPISTAPKNAETGVDVSLLDPQLLVDRLYYGEAMYTSGQLATIVHRARGLQHIQHESTEQTQAANDIRRSNARRVRPAEASEDDVFEDVESIFAAHEQNTGADFQPGLEVLWTDDSGAWEGWICTSGVVRLTQVPSGAIDKSLSSGDQVVWIVSKAEWERANEENREPSAELSQPVRVDSLRLSM